MDLSVGIDKI